MEPLLGCACSLCPAGDAAGEAWHHSLDYPLSSRDEGDFLVHNQ